MQYIFWKLAPLDFRRGKEGDLLLNAKRLFGKYRTRSLMFFTAVALRDDRAIVGDAGF